MPVVQFARFRIAEEREEAVLAVRDSALEQFRRQHPGLIESLLVRLEGGDWLDIVVWDDASEDDTGELCPANPPSEDRREFFAAVEELLGEESGELVRSSTTFVSDEAPGD